jgi:hypothetical protein
MLNPFTTTAKLVKTEKIASEVQKDLNTMNKTNWKTNTIGVITLLIGLSQLWAPSSIQPKISATAGLLAGAGLIAAKDASNKS